MEIRVSKAALLALALISTGVILRLVPHAANFAPVGALALFGGAVLSKRVAIWLPLVVMAITDLILGLHNAILFTWGAFLLVALVGIGLRRASNWWRAPLGAIASSLIFFIVSNFGVWLVSGMYEHSLVGLERCYVAALPFVRSTIVSDMFFSVVLFGAYAALGSRSRLQGTLTLWQGRSSAHRLPVREQ